MRFARRLRCLSLCARFPPFAASSYDRSAVRVTTFASATNGYSHNIYTVWSLCLIFLPVYVSRIFYRCAISWVEARILSRILFDYDVYIPTYQYLLASFFSNPYSLHLTSSSRPFSLLPFRWLLYAFAIRVFQRLYTLHEISYSEYIIQRKEMDEGKTLLVLVCTVTSALGGSSS